MYACVYRTLKQLTRLCWDTVGKDTLHILLDSKGGLRATPSPGLHIWQVGRLDRALILLGLAVCLPSASVSPIVVLLYIFRYFCHILYFIFQWAAPGGIGRWPGWLTIVLHRWQAFCVAGPSVWNSLPDSLRNPIIGGNSFRQSLKTFLFTTYWCIQRIRGFTTMRYINRLFTYFLISVLVGSFDP